MKKIMDKLLSKIKLNKKILLFLTIITVIGLISGALLVVLLDKGDKTIINTYLTNFIEDISQNRIQYFLVLKDSLISNIVLILGIWLLGISVIGIPVVLFLYFSQIFTLGFAIASILLKYKFKGLILSIIYIFPNYLIYMITLIIITSYSISLSIKIISSIINKKQLDFKVIFNKYLYILGMSFITIILYCVYETFAIPNIIKLIIPILK